MNVWVVVGWVGGICLCILFVLATINVAIVVARNVSRPKPPVPPPLPPAAMYPPRETYSPKPWDGSGRGTG